MYANITAAFVHVALAVTLAVIFDMGMLGVAIATSIQFIVRFLVTVGYVRFSGKFDAEVY